MAEMTKMTKKTKNLTSVNLYSIIIIENKPFENKGNKKAKVIKMRVCFYSKRIEKGGIIMKVFVKNTIREATKKVCKKFLKSVSKTKKRKIKLSKKYLAKKITTFTKNFFAIYACALEIFFVCLFGHLINHLTSFDNNEANVQYFTTNSSSNRT